MPDKYTEEEEGVLTFFSWSNGHDIENISQEIKEAMYPTISQLPEASKRMCYRMGIILKHNLENPLTDHEFWDMNVEDQKLFKKESIGFFFKKFELSERLHELYLDFSNTLIGIQFDENQGESLQEKIKLIVEEESK